MGSQQDSAELLLVGRVSRTHGVAGEIRIAPESDDPSRLLELDVLFIGRDERRRSAYRVEAMRLQQSRRGFVAVTKLEGIAEPDEAELLKGQDVYARTSDLPALEDDEYYLHDIVGMRVVLESGEDVGTVSEVMDLPAHPVYVVHRPGRPDAMVPAVDEFVVDVDFDEKLVTIRPIEGLLD